jgi:tRNA-dihydrouridine synthase
MQRTHALPGEFAPLSIGNIDVEVPVILAPMAGITNAPFRTLCRQFGAGLYVSEMLGARPIAIGDQHTLELAEFGADETVRSIQIYATDAESAALATKRLVTEGAVDHIDMNFGCPAPKVTRHGG